MFFVVDLEKIKAQKIMDKCKKNIQPDGKVCSDVINKQKTLPYIYLIPIKFTMKM
jgi:hypothetical protein